MLGLEDYGSGSESDDSTPKESHKPSKTTKPKKKITIGLPTLKHPQNEDELKDERPPAKRPRLDTGKGSSALFSMLPAPKQKDPVPQSTERVLGSGKGPSLVFDVPQSSNPMDDIQTHGDSSSSDFPSMTSSATMLLPPSLLKGRSNVSLDGPTKKPPVVAAPPVDFFSLDSSASTRDSTGIASSSTSTITAAPIVPDFKVPEPSLEDRNPGYYQLPSGAWAAHDPEYYESFRKKWEKQYNDYVRALEKGTIKGFEGADGPDVESVDAAREMEKAKKEVKEREERKAISRVAQGAPDQPKMKMTAAKMSGVARSRHQLATLLNEAYQNREALEERIAEGRRNRKEAGNKYGF
ncbi:hypothetical protein VKT23_004230 [Stygiomarasmius scandens]|uniref:Mitotic checkpoint regulator, MAD2B-interacting-domain-containing protein n=1 Tax=Marasmiellus scandens TaxID=2682957 RepID=A0ABR1JTI6_9AGAR